jgi:hypothetical protein
MEKMNQEELNLWLNKVKRASYSDYTYFEVIVLLMKQVIRAIFEIKFYQDAKVDCKVMSANEAKSLFKFIYNTEVEYFNPEESCFPERVETRNDIFKEVFTFKVNIEDNMSGLIFFGSSEVSFESVWHESIMNFKKIIKELFEWLYQKNGQLPCYRKGILIYYKYYNHFLREINPGFQPIKSELPLPDFKMNKSDFEKLKDKYCFESLNQFLDEFRSFSKILFEAVLLELENETCFLEVLERRFLTILDYGIWN